MIPPEGITMDEPIKRWMAAIVLSFILPQAVVNLGSSMMATPDAEPTTPSTTPIEIEEPFKIPVLIDGSTITFLDLEEYVRGVVLAEVPAYFEADALSAQAVAARTYAMRRIFLKDRHRYGAVCTDHTCCQAWISDEDYLAQRGGKKDLEKVTAAVTQTAGQVLTFGGKLAETTYFSCSGGQTEDAFAVWGESIHYLQSQPSPGEEYAAGYEQQLHFTPADFSDALGLSLSGDPSQWFGPATYTEGGGVATMVIGDVSYSGTTLRTLLGLNSTLFSITTDGDTITVTAKGHGHRVGMSQYGANAMAMQGRAFDEILAYYYPGTVIDKLSDVE